MRQALQRLFGSVWAGLMTGLLIGGFAVVPVAVSAQANNDERLKASTEVQLKSESNKWAASNAAKPGETLRYIVSYQNVSNTQQRQVTVRAALPDKTSLVPGTTTVTNTRNPNGVKFENDNIAKNGIMIGSYGPGANAYVTFEVMVASSDQLACGSNSLKATGAVKAEGVDEKTSEAVTTVERSCQQQPAPASPAPITPATPPAQTPAATPAPAAGKTSNLPQTGPGSVVGLFVGASIVGFVGHHLLLIRRANR
jgi:uncharacterized repeat protein (TIGR01451 family)